MRGTMSFLSQTRFDKAYDKDYDDGRAAQAALTPLSPEGTFAEDPG